MFTFKSECAGPTRDYHNVSGDLGLSSGKGHSNFGQNHIIQLLGNNRFLMIRGRYRTAVSKVWLVGSHSPLLLVTVCKLAEDAGHQGEKYRRPSIKKRDDLC